MKSKITQFDTFAFNISDAYKHKNILGGIFTILYALCGIALFIYLIVYYCLQSDQISSKIIIDFATPISPINDSSFNILGTATLLHASSDITQFNQYFRFFASIRLNTGQLLVSILPCVTIPETNSQCKFTITQQDYQEKVKDHIDQDAMQFGYMSCKNINALSTEGRIIVSNQELMEGCKNDLDDTMLKGELQFEYEMPYHEFTYPVIRDRQIVKKYKIDNRIGKGYHQMYSMNMHLCNVIYDNYLFFGKKYDKTFYNWLEPLKINSNKIQEGHSLTVVLSNRNKSKVFYYIVSKTSMMKLLIDFGAFFQLYCVLTFVPLLWHGYIIEKAYLVLCSLFNLKHLNLSAAEDQSSLNESPSDSYTSYDWRKYSYGMYLCTKYCCCCLSSSSKPLKATKDKILAAMECTSFIKFDADHDWADIAKYMPHYISNENDN